MALGSPQPLTEMSTKNSLGGKGQPACKADNLTTIHEPIVQKMWEPRCLTTLWAFMACYKDSFTLFFAICEELPAINTNITEKLKTVSFP
jgi:hypothetical protein